MTLKMCEGSVVVRSDLFDSGNNLVENGYTQVDSQQCQGSSESSQVEVFYVDQFGEDTPVIISDEPINLKDESDDNVSAIFIEVPQITPGEPLAYAELENLKFTNEQQKFETDPLKEDTDGNIPLTKIIPLRDKDNSSKNCFLIQNGKNMQPLYIVKKPNLLENCEEALSSRSSTIKTDKTLDGSYRPKANQSEPDRSANEDLTWLLNFKLDNIFNDASCSFQPLDDTNDCQKKDYDAKDKDLGDSKKVKTTESSTDSQSPLKKKPPFTYTELIECALEEKGPLTVSGIYQWISETFPYYKSWDDRWKNSVRHNLSINPYFRKGTKARGTSGHLWTVSKSAERSKSWSWKRQKYQEFEEYTKRFRMTDQSDQSDQRGDEDEAALAVASIEDKENRGLHRDVLFATHNQGPVMDVSMEQTAEEILSGVKRNVEVEYLDSSSKVEAADGNDFLNPVSKEVLMDECGFLNQIELNLTAEATGHLEVDSDQVFEIPEELGFQYSDFTVQGQQLLPLVN